MPGLAELFLEGRAPPHPPLAELEAVLARLSAEGREPLPDLAYDERAFVRVYACGQNARLGSRW